MDGLFYFRYLQGHTYLPHRKNRFHMNDGIGEGDGGCGVSCEYERKGGLCKITLVIQYALRDFYKESVKSVDFPLRKSKIF